MIIDVWSSLVELVKKLEGLVLTPYPSMEGGMPTIGYGHKLTIGEDIKELTEHQAESLLIMDLQKAHDRAATYFTPQELFNMPPSVKALATELVFNIGSLQGYPKFRAKAAGRMDGDPVSEINRTYINRQGIRVHLTWRVEAIKDWYYHING